MTEVNHEKLKEDLHGIIVMNFHVKLNPITENSGLLITCNPNMQKYDY